MERPKRPPRSSTGSSALRPRVRGKDLVSRLAPAHREIRHAALDPPASFVDFDRKDDDDYAGLGRRFRFLKLESRRERVAVFPG